MSEDILQIDYDQMEQIANQFQTQADVVDQMLQSLNQPFYDLQNGGWIGEAADSFFQEYETEIQPAIKRLSQALLNGSDVSNRIIDVIATAEEEAAAQFTFEGEGGTSGEGAGGVGGDASNVDRSIAGTILGILDKVVTYVDGAADYLPIPAALALASGLARGTSYAGQVIVKFPKWVSNLPISKSWLKGFAGVAENLSHIGGRNADTIAKHIIKNIDIGPLDIAISAGQGIVGVGSVWNENWSEYETYDTPKHITAMAVDASIALVPVATEFAGGMGGAIAGAKVGAAIGAFGGPVGVVAGGIIGGVVGGAAGDWLGGEVGDIIADKIDASGIRDNAIDLIDRNIAQPIANGINSAIDAIGNIELPSISLPDFSFGF